VGIIFQVRQIFHDRGVGENVFCRRNKNPQYRQMVIPNYSVNCSSNIQLIVCTIATVDCLNYVANL